MCTVTAKRNDLKDDGDLSALPAVRKGDLIGRSARPDRAGMNGNRSGHATQVHTDTHVKSASDTLFIKRRFLRPFTTLTHIRAHSRTYSNTEPAAEATCVRRGGLGVSLLHLTDDRSACQSSGTKSFVGWIMVLQATASRARVTPWVTPWAQSAQCLTAEEGLRFGKGAPSDLKVLN